MKLTLEVIDTNQEFTILVKDESGETIRKVEYEGYVLFGYKGEDYAILTPYHGTPNNKIILYKLEEIARA